MTEADWLNCDDALALLDHLYPQRGLDSVEPQSRASRLYLLACARRHWDRLPGVCRAIVAVAEQAVIARPIDSALREQIYPLAEELTHLRGEAELVNAVGSILVSMGFARAEEVLLKADLDPLEWSSFAHLVYFPFCRTTPTYQRIRDDFHSADLVREVFGNPFAPPEFLDPNWISETVLQLALHAKKTADFSSFPFLADALEEAGCDHTAILDHFRGRNGHVRGCWALELILQ